MPCSYFLSQAEANAYYADQETKKAQKAQHERDSLAQQLHEARTQAAEYKKELDKATRLLCALTSVLPESTYCGIRGMKTWVRKHAVMDRKRLASNKR